jgi:hypothetical protein
MSTMDWYLGVSRDRGVGPRCPFASVERCPRFYLSTSVLNSVDHQPQNEALDRRWQQSELYPRREDEFPSASGGKALHYGRFCPEVAHERFGRFASDLTEYYDADERHAGQQEAENGGPEWKSDWLQVTPRHYTECPVYSPLLHSPAHLSNPDAQTASAVVPTQETAPVLVLKPTLWGMSIDLYQAWKRGRKWLADRVGRSS